MQAQIDQLIQESLRIAEEVKLNNWSVVEHMAEERQKNLEAFFADPIETADSQKVSDMIHRILEIDRQVIDDIVADKNETLSSFKTLNQQSKAQKSYQNVASFSAG